MASAWVYQRVEQVRDMGADKAPWYVGWCTPDGQRKGKSCGPGEGGKRKADKLRRKIEAELMCGIYRDMRNVSWADFRARYEETVLALLRPGTQRTTRIALGHFERIVKPHKIYLLGAEEFARYTAQRLTEDGHKPDPDNPAVKKKVSAASVNKELRHLKAVIKVAVEWKHLDVMPKVRMLREDKKLARYVTGDDFALIYAACDHARMPVGLPFPAADWWRGLLVAAYMTGWRIGELLALRRDDLDAEKGTALTRAEDNKGHRDALVQLHPVVLEHVKRLPCFEPFVFPWPHDPRTLYVVFHEIQAAAKLPEPYYGFHDFRRAFATMNADKLTPDALQSLMRHKSYLTTQKYINLARQMTAAVAGLHVPEVLKKSAVTQ